MLDSLIASVSLLPFVYQTTALISCAGCLSKIEREVGGLPGVALAVGGIVMWMLLHFTRLMRVLQGAANRPVGYCDSAVMLNAKLKTGVTLMHVIAMTRALGSAWQASRAAAPIRPH